MTTPATYACRMCGTRFVWESAFLQGYQSSGSLTCAPLELRACPNEDCQNTLAQTAEWSVIENAIRQIPDRTQRSAALVALADHDLRLRVEETEKASVKMVNGLAEDFACDHGRLLEERCIQCEREAREAANPPSSRVGKSARR